MRPQNWLDSLLFESLNRGLLFLRTDVAVAFEPLTADVSSEP